MKTKSMEVTGPVNCPFRNNDDQGCVCYFPDGPTCEPNRYNDYKFDEHRFPEKCPLLDTIFTVEKYNET